MGLKMRSCLQKGCASSGKVTQTPGAITTCRLSRPEMPATGPGRGVVPGQRCQRQGQAGEWCWAEQDVCAAGRGRQGSGNSAPAQSVNTHSRAKRKCSVYYPLCCVIWPAASLGATANTELITQHSSQLTQKQPPTHPQPWPVEGGRAASGPQKNKG